MVLSETTQLTAFNRIMAAVQRPPVSTVPSVSADAEQEQALNSLDDAAREVLSEGRSFNTDLEYELVPVGSEITVPTDAISIEVLPEYLDGDKFDIREGKLYNLTESSFTITRTLRARVAFQVEFEDMPETIRQYVTAKAARMFEEAVQGSQQAGRRLRIREAETRAAVEKEEAKVHRPNLFYGGPIQYELDPSLRTRRW
jgi:hypothetical protein